MYLEELLVEVQGGTEATLLHVALFTGEQLQ
jgi:hypothetical protein